MLLLVKKSEIVILILMVKDARSLTFVPFHRSSLLEYANMKSISYSSKTLTVTFLATQLLSSKKFDDTVQIT